MFVSCKCCVLSEVSIRRADHSSKRSRTECGVSECDRESSIMRRTWPTGGCCSMINENAQERGWQPLVLERYVEMRKWSRFRAP